MTKFIGNEKEFYKFVPLKGDQCFRGTHVVATRYGEHRFLDFVGGNFLCVDDQNMEVPLELYDNEIYTCQELLVSTIQCLLGANLFSYKEENVVMINRCRNLLCDKFGMEGSALAKLNFVIENHTDTRNQFNVQFSDVTPTSMKLTWKVGQESMRSDELFLTETQLQWKNFEDDHFEVEEMLLRHLEWTRDREDFVSEAFIKACDLLLKADKPEFKQGPEIRSLAQQLIDLHL